MARLSFMQDVATYFVEEAPDKWSEPVLTPHVLSGVRISESSGNSSVDAQGTQGARTAILFFVRGYSKLDGSLLLPSIPDGVKLCRGVASAVPADAWTVRGTTEVKDGTDAVHHLEVSLV
jgi:hypothetical protein